jgi:hypothetical protein
MFNRVAVTSVPTDLDYNPVDGRFWFPNANGLWAIAPRADTADRIDTEASAMPPSAGSRQALAVQSDGGVWAVSQVALEHWSLGQAHSDQPFPLTMTASRTGLLAESGTGLWWIDGQTDTFRFWRFDTVSKRLVSNTWSFTGLNALVGIGLTDDGKIWYAGRVGGKNAIGSLNRQTVATDAHEAAIELNLDPALAMTTPIALAVSGASGAHDTVWVILEPQVILRATPPKAITLKPTLLQSLADWDACGVLVSHAGPPGITHVTPELEATELNLGDALANRSPALLAIQTGTQPIIAVSDQKFPEIRFFRQR